MGDRNDQGCCENKNNDAKETGKTTSTVDIVDKELQNEASLGIERSNDKDPKETGKTTSKVDIVDKELQNEEKGGCCK